MEYGILLLLKKWKFLNHLIRKLKYLLLMRLNIVLSINKSFMNI